MVQDKNLAEVDSIAEILSRAFDASAKMPPVAAQLILRAKLPNSDVQCVDELLLQKREGRLNAEQEALLRDYLQADSILTLLKSKARQAIGAGSA